MRETEEFTVPMPPSYYDATDEVASGKTVLVFAAKKLSRGYRPMISILKAPLPGGTFDEAAACAQTGRGIVDGGTESPGTGGVLKSAQIIDGPVGKSCQIRVVTRRGVAIITELHRAGNSASTPKPIWIMTCNHADGDDVAESVCRGTLSGFRFRSQ